MITGCSGFLFFHIIFSLHASGPPVPIPFWICSFLCLRHFPLSRVLLICLSPTGITRLDSFFLVFFFHFWLSYFPWLLAIWDILFLFELPHLSVVIDLADSFFRVFHILLMIFFPSVSFRLVVFFFPGLPLVNFSILISPFRVYPVEFLIFVFFRFSSVSHLYTFLICISWILTLFQFSLVLFLPWEPVRASFNAYGPIEKFLFLRRFVWGPFGFLLSGF